MTDIALLMVAFVGGLLGLVLWSINRKVDEMGRSAPPPHDDRIDRMLDGDDEGRPAP